MAETVDLTGATGAVSSLTTKFLAGDRVGLRVTTAGMGVAHLTLGLGSGGRLYQFQGDADLKVKTTSFYWTRRTPSIATTGGGVEQTASTRAGRLTRVSYKTTTLAPAASGFPIDPPTFDIFKNGSFEKSLILPDPITSATVAEGVIILDEPIPFANGDTLQIRLGYLSGSAATVVSLGDTNIICFMEAGT